MIQTDESATDKDWRLSARLEIQGAARLLPALVGRLHPQIGADERGEAFPHDVVITHDGETLFAYAATKDTLMAARRAIEEALRRERITATISISHWSDELDEWRQTDPPLDAEAARVDAAAVRDAEAIETRTMVASAGREIRAEFEQTMRDWAAKLDLECVLVEHKHLLRTQVCFTVTGPKGKIDEFARGLTAEEWATIRTETAVMASPL